MLEPKLLTLLASKERCEDLAFLMAYLESEIISHRVRAEKAAARREHDRRAKLDEEDDDDDESTTESKAIDARIDLPARIANFIDSSVTELRLEQLEKVQAVEQRGQDGEHAADRAAERKARNDAQREAEQEAEFKVCEWFAELEKQYPAPQLKQEGKEALMLSLLREESRANGFLEALHAAIEVHLEQAEAAEQGGAALGGAAWQQNEFGQQMGEMFTAI